MDIIKNALAVNLKIKCRWGKLIINYQPIR